MTVRELRIVNFRNLREGTFHPCEGVNVICGNNAQGKTNLLEALWLCSGARSFRGAKDSELIAFGRDRAKLELTFFAREREQKATLQWGEKKNVFLNGVEKKTTSDLYETVCMVLFAPDHLSLVKDGPAERRAFVDFALSRLKPSFLALQEQYDRALEQRNALLRGGKNAAAVEGLMDLWEDALARLGSIYARQRQKYVERVAPAAAAFYRQLSGGRETLALTYDGADCSSDNDGYETLKEMLRSRRETDLRLGYTTAGPHRHDLLLTINGASARQYGSQGQQRSAALALKMAEAEVLADYCGQTPAILLDDVMSELDGSRQDFLLNRFSGRQIFLTCCDPAPLGRLTEGKVFWMENGELHERA